MSATLLGGPRIGGRGRAALRDPDDRGWLVVALTVVAALPIAVAGIRAALDGWLAVGDNANFLIRSRDVLTRNNPLLGTWSSASVGIGHDVNHPGPLLFDLLALPARLGGSAGMALAVAALNAACVACIAVFARRAGGTRGALAALAASSGLSWTLGSALLHDAWNPHVVLFPYLLVLVLVWAMATGDLAALPVAAFVASVVVQTHVSFALPVVVPSALGVVLLVAVRRRAVRVPLVIAAVVLVLCWAQPVFDQVFGDGNLTTLARGASDAGRSIGPARGAELTADVVALPPWWGRPSFDDAVRFPPGQPRFLADEPNVDGVPSLPTAVMALLALAGIVVVSVVVGRRHRDRSTVALLAVASCATVTAYLAITTQPVGAIGLSAHQLRYLWPIAALLTTGIVVALVPWRRASQVLGAATVVCSALAIPAHASDSGPAGDADVIPSMRSLAAQMEGVKLDEPVLVDTAVRYAEPWTAALMAQLQDEGVEFHVADRGAVRQLGSRRRANGRERSRLFVREGTFATVVPDGARRVAFVPGLDDDERAELGRLERALDDLPLVLDRLGQAAVASGGLAGIQGETTASPLLADGRLAAMVHDGLLSIPPSRQATVDRYVELRRRWDRHTVAVFVSAPDDVPG